MKNSEPGGSVYFFGSELWLKFTFLGEKTKIIFLGWKIVKLFFGVTQGDKIYFGRRSRYRLGYFFVHNSFNKKDGSTRCTHKLDRERGTSIIPSMAVEKKNVYSRSDVQYG